MEEISILKNVILVKNCEILSGEKYVVYNKLLYQVMM